MCYLCICCSQDDSHHHIDRNSFHWCWSNCHTRRCQHHHIRSRLQVWIQWMYIIINIQCLFHVRAVKVQIPVWLLYTYNNCIFSDNIVDEVCWSSELVEKIYSLVHVVNNMNNVSIYKILHSIPFDTICVLIMVATSFWTKLC